MNENVKNRLRLLQALYDAREARPKQGWMFEHELRGLVAEPAFALEILKEQGYIEARNPGYRISAKGVLAFEATQDE